MQTIQECRVRRCARPLQLKNGHERAVLCLHGFMGYPGEMAYPAQRLHEAGWDVYVPRLTGHGTCGADFRSTGVSDWVRQVQDIWLNLTPEYRELAVLGHSMGGLLALDLATRCPLDKLAVMAPAIGIPAKGGFVLKLLSFFLRRTRGKWASDPDYEFFDERDADDDEYLGKEYWSWIWFRQLSGLLKLQKKTSRRLGKIATPVLGIFGENDTVVGKGGIRLLAAKLKVPYEQRILSKCRHYIPYDPNPGSKEEAMDEVISWFSGQ